ncbi:MAG TPA: hypothetical protein VJS86_02785 [Arthrobacter sp.]|nr:hypothetical protein [Arthrobacter sp.]
MSGLARTLRNLLFRSRKDGDYQYNDWLYGQDSRDAARGPAAGPRLGKPLPLSASGP